MAITPEVIAKVEECIPLGPLHNPPNLVGIRLAQELFPELPQVGVFDTAFHQTMPPVAYTYPVPHEWLETHGVRRYGFHGTSHRFVAKQALQLTGLSPENHRLVTAHLGNGCSCAAVRDGKSVDTTMGLTPLEGVMMGTRSGSIDPAIIGHISGALNKTSDRILDALNKKSGLLGVSGLSNDMRTIETAAAGGNERARLAFDLFCYILAKAIAALVVPLGRLDALVFTGGIGENSVTVRERTVAHLGFLGLTIDPEANADARAKPERPRHRGNAAPGAGGAHQRRAHDCPRHGGDCAPVLTTVFILFLLRRKRCLPPSLLPRPAGASD